MIANIQALRAVAALLVVYYHLQSPLRTYLGVSTQTAFGASGVDVFFVISGFIMFHTNRDHTRTGGTFIQDRLIRIVPLYWLATGLILAIYAMGRNPDGVQAVDLGDIVTSLSFIPDVRADGVKSPVLTLGWTLIYEMFFYAIFAALLFLRDSRQWLIGLFIVFCTLVAYGAMAEPTHHSIRYFTNPIVFEFLLGAALAIAYDRHSAKAQQPHRIGWMLAFVAGWLLIVATEWLDKGFMKDGNPLRPLLFGLPAGLIVWSALMLERAGVVWRAAWLQLWGAASYALYLFHPVVIQTCTLLSGKVLGALMGPALKSGAIGTVAAAGTATVSIAAAIIVAIVVHRWIELPITHSLKRRFGRR